MTQNIYGINAAQHNGKSYLECNGTWYNAATPYAVIQALEESRLAGYRVRLFYGDAATGKSWHEENDVSGTIGRSGGSVKRPLMIHNSRSSSGPTILDHCIIGIKVRYRWHYRHPTLDLGVWDIRNVWHGQRVGNTDLHEAGYRFTAYCDNTMHANFKTYRAAMQYLAFMRGERLTK